MGKRKKSQEVIKLISLFSFCFIFTIISLQSFSKSYPAELEEIFKSESYSTLPEPAKDYITEVYEETGNILATESTKEENIPYLNPAYVEYLSLSESEKAKVEVIPSETVVDYPENTTISDISETDDSSDIPASFDLRNVNGVSYITNLKNQNPLSICWTFATAEQAESYAILNGMNDEGENLSARQIDYATASNGIENYKNIFSKHELGEGGNFFMSSEMLITGQGLVKKENFYGSEDWLVYYAKESTGELTMLPTAWFGTETFACTDSAHCTNENGETLDERLHEERSISSVQNFSNSKYEVNSTAEFYQNYTTEEQRQQIKQIIMTNGGTYSDTQAAHTNCGAKNIDGYYIVNSDVNCNNSYSNHAIQIIGWDDNYSYAYCPGSTHISVTTNDDNYICTNGKTPATGTGAWLARNSYGNTTGANDYYDYFYIAYSSKGTTFAAITDMSLTADRTWDNVYYNSFGSPYITSETGAYSRQNTGKEKVEKIKFRTENYNSQYKIELQNANGTILASKIVDTTYPGYYTIDFSSENITYDANETIKYIISDNTGSSIFWQNSFAVFTSNIDETQIITPEKNADQPTENDGQYETTISYDTWNINSGTTLNIELTTIENGAIIDKTDDLIYKNNTVGSNKAIIFYTFDSKKFPTGYYKLRVYDQTEGAYTIIKIGNFTDQILYTSTTGGILEKTTDNTKSSIFIDTVNQDSNGSFIITNKDNLSQIIAVPDPGYDFVGWYETREDNNYSEASPISTETLFEPEVNALGIIRAKNYTAVFEPKNIKVTYKLGYEENAIFAETTGKYGDKISVPNNPTRDYYSFTNWSEDITTFPDEDIIITAQWTPNNYTVTINTNNSNGTITAKKLENIPYNSQINISSNQITINSQTISATPNQQTGQTIYIFSNWSFENCTNINNLYYTTNNCLITANFSQKIAQYTVNFDLNGGSGNISAKTVNYGEKITEPSNILKIGYIQDGWYTTSGEKFDFSKGITSNITLAAKWYLLGDTNLDDKISAQDYVKIKNYIMGKTTFTELEKKIADYKQDGQIRATDYKAIKNYIMNK